MTTPSYEEQVVMASEMATKIFGIFNDQPVAACMWALGIALGRAAANSSKRDLDELMERIRPIAQSEMADTLARWAREDAERQRPN